MNERLTTKEYWETAQDADLEARSSTETAEEKQPPWWRNPGSYNSYLHDQFVAMHLPKDGKMRFMEVGAAPGRNLIKFHREFGYIPFGVEYTSLGVSAMNKLLAENNIPQDNAIQADFFDPSFQARHQDSFDVVASFGFLEHFANPKEVVAKHLNILKPGGYLLITIPNLRYVNYYLKCFFNTDFIVTHNLELMDLDRFRECFVFDDFQIAACRYLGGFMFPQPTHTSPWKRIIEKVMAKQQLLLNVPLRIAFGADGPESRYFSGNLACVGRKR